MLFALPVTIAENISREVILIPIITMISGSLLEYLPLVLFAGVFICSADYFHCTNLIIKKLETCNPCPSKQQFQSHINQHIGLVLGVMFLALYFLIIKVYHVIHLGIPSLYDATYEDKAWNIFYSMTATVMWFALLHAKKEQNPNSDIYVHTGGCLHCPPKSPRNDRHDS